MPGIEFAQTRSTVDEQLALYTNYVGACERIYRTPIPIAFTVCPLLTICYSLANT